MIWCFFKVIAIRKAPSFLLHTLPKLVLLPWPQETQTSLLVIIHANKLHDSGLLLIEFDSEKKLYLGYHTTLR